MTLKILAFDCFGTVFDIAGIPKEEVRDYIAQVRRPIWAPLSLPQSWATLPAHPDAAEGLKRLRKSYRVVTCSNLPRDLLLAISQNSGIEWDAIVPLEASRSYKPSPSAYRTVCEVLQVAPEDVAVVTAHPDGPDIGGSASVGMGCFVIRNGGFAKDIIELAERLEANA